MNYKLEGTPNSPVLMFSNSLGCTYEMWHELIPALLPFFRILRYNTKGQNSDKNKTLSIEDLGQEVMDLLDNLNIEKVYFCGLSMGGLIGQWLAINYPKRIKKLVLSNTAAKIGTDERWNDRIKTINNEGLQAIVDETMERWFTENFQNSQGEVIAKTKTMFLASNVESYTNCCAAIRDADFREKLNNISQETLVITGDEDPVTNIEQAEFLVNKIPNAKLKILHARHLSSTELPKEYAEILIDFLVDESPFGRGMHVRKTVLGEAHVNKATENINDFNADFQKFITNYAWGEIWTRPGMSKHNRSLITMAMLIALNRPAEFKMHVKAALNNGVSKEEIKEVIMQSAIYCGLPAANDAFHLASEILNEVSYGV